MDAAGLSILLAELQADCSVVTDAGRKAGLRLREPTPGHLEACAYELARLLSAAQSTQRFATLAERTAESGMPRSNVASLPPCRVASPSR